MTPGEHVAPVPLPASLAWGDGAPFALTAEAAISGDADAAAFAAELLGTRTGLALGTADEGRIELRRIPGGPAESYRIAVDAASVRVEAPDAAGLFYATHTLAQLVRPDGDGWAIPAVAIADAPRFAYRGVMLDVARHFFPVEVVRGWIDRAASLKLNHLHLHLTDDQGWRLELASRPALARAASGSAVDGDPGGFYTRADYREIVRHAASRHMTVVPEVDVPGHTHAVGLAHPELVEEPVLGAVAEPTGALPARGVAYTGTEVGFSSLRIGDEGTYDFLADVFGELAGLTPGPYLHLGGDEARGTDADDYAEFVARATRIVADLGKTPVMWHEAGAVADRADETVGQYWDFVTPREPAATAARAFAADGSRVILSPADAVYLDMKEEPGSRLGQDWADGPTSLERAYGWEPADVLGIPERALLGVEAPLWTETARTADDLDELAFPRIAAAAEIAWSPRAAPERAWESFRVRVGALAPLWRAHGIRFHPSPLVPWQELP
jgi:N-acetyl-beta-hexosaminidase